MVRIIAGQAAGGCGALDKINVGVVKSSILLISGSTREAASHKRKVWKVLEISGIQIRHQALIKQEALRQVPRRA
jgi:hypothetical protein